MSLSYEAAQLARQCLQSGWLLLRDWAFGPGTFKDSCSSKAFTHQFLPACRCRISVHKLTSTCPHCKEPVQRSLILTVRAYQIRKWSSYVRILIGRTRQHQCFFNEVVQFCYLHHGVDSDRRKALGQQLAARNKNWLATVQSVAGWSTKPHTTLKFKCVEGTNLLLSGGNREWVTIESDQSGRFVGRILLPMRLALAYCVWN